MNKHSQLFLTRLCVYLSRRWFAPGINNQGDWFHLKSIISSYNLSHMAEKPWHIFLINLLSYSIGWPHSSGCFTYNLLSHSCFHFSTGVFAMYITTASLLSSRAHEWKHLPSIGEDLRRSSPPWKTVLSHVSWSFGPDGFSMTQAFFFYHSSSFRKHP